MISFKIFIFNFVLIFDANFCIVYFFFQTFTGFYCHLKNAVLHGTKLIFFSKRLNSAI